MGNDKIAINRTLVGVLAICCLVGAVSLHLLVPGSDEARLWLAGFIRVGLVLAAFWIALPSGDRQAAWANLSRNTLIGIVLGMLALFRLPFRIVLPVAISIAVIGYMLHPRGKQRPRSRAPRSVPNTPRAQGQPETLSPTQSDV
jgi:hypothetical protein